MKLINAFFIPLPWWCYVGIFLYFVHFVKYHKSIGGFLLFPVTVCMDASLCIILFVILFAPLHTFALVLLGSFLPYNLFNNFLVNLHANIALYIMGSSPLPVYLNGRIIGNNNYWDDVIYWLLVILDTIADTLLEFVKTLNILHIDPLGFEIHWGFTKVESTSKLRLIAYIRYWNTVVTDHLLVIAYIPLAVIWSHYKKVYGKLELLTLVVIFTAKTGYSPPLNYEDEEKIKQSIGLNETVLTTSNSGEGFVKYCDTKQLKGCRENVLQKILNDLGPNDILGNWLMKNASHLLREPKGNTHITLDIVSNENLSKGVKLDTEFVSSNHTNSTGVYVVQNANKDIYVGSSLDFKSRWRGRYIARVQEVWFANVDLKTIVYTEFGQIPHYTNLFYQQYPQIGKPPALYAHILQMFTLYETRLLEQAIIYHLIPNLNTQIIVLLKQSYDIESTLKSTKAQEVTIKSLESGMLIYCKSQLEAARITGVHPRSVSKALNYKNLGNNLMSPQINEMVTFNDTKGNIPTKIHLKRPPAQYLIGIPYEKIPGSAVWVFNKNIEHIKSFDNVILAAKFYKVSRDSIYIYLNNDYVFIKSVKAELLFARNPLHNPINIATAVIVYDNKSHQAYSYNSNRSALAALALSAGSNIKNYLDTNRVWKDQFTIYSTDNAPTTPVIEGPKTLVLKPVKSNLPVAYVVDTASTPVTVYSFIVYSKALAFIGCTKNIQKTPSNVFKPYADNHKIYKDRYLIYTTHNLPPQYTKDV